MEPTQEILARARERAQQMNLPYAGAFLPAEAYVLIQSLTEANLVDVRTRAALVGNTCAAFVDCVMIVVCPESLVAIGFPTDL